LDEEPFWEDPKSPPFPPEDEEPFEPEKSERSVSDMRMGGSEGAGK
jgi:hypothetical protein